MIDLNAALCHHLFELPIADWIGHIPSDAPQDDITLELAAFEIDHGRRTGRLLPVSLRALGKVSKFATEPLRTLTRTRCARSCPHSSEKNRFKKSLGQRASPAARL